MIRKRPAKKAKNGVGSPLKKRGSYGLFHYLEPGSRNNRIRSCPNSPLKKQKRRCPTGERQRLFCDFVAAYCGLRSSAIPVTSKEKRDGKKNQTNNVLLFI